MEQVLLQCHLVQTRHLSEDGWWEKCLQSHHHHYWSPGRGKPLPWELERPSCFLLRFRGSSSEQLSKYFYYCIWVNCCSEDQHHAFRIFKYLDYALDYPSSLQSFAPPSVTQQKRALCWQTKSALNMRKIKGWFAWVRKSYGQFNKW